MLPICSVQPVQHGEDRLGQEVEPAPVDRIEEPGNALVILIAADRCPFLRPSEKAQRRRRLLAGGKGDRRRAHLGLIDPRVRHVLQHRLVGFALFGDQRGHPVVVGKPDPAIDRSVRHDGGKAFVRVDLELGHSS
jgi:hypothetical protein